MAASADGSLIDPPIARLTCRVGKHFMENAMSIGTDRLESQVREVVDDVEELLEATRDTAGEQLQQARATVAESLRAVNRRLQTAAAEAGECAQHAATRARKEVEEHPWAAIGIAAMVGVALGVLVRRK